MSVEKTQEVEETLSKIVAKITRKENVTLSPTTTFKELGADSLDVVQIMVALEEAFDIELVDEELKGITTMGDFIDYVKKKVSEKGG
ncbi:MAG: acyl carrier protein [Dehalococcoidales bacterium]|nr:acyl carrier protein [Dehalococcoidales bacterium]